MNNSTATTLPKAGFGKRFHAWLMAKLSKKHDQELLNHTKSSAREIAENSMKIAASVCVFTNESFIVEEL